MSQTADDDDADDDADADDDDDDPTQSYYIIINHQMKSFLSQLETANAWSGGRDVSWEGRSRYTYNSRIYSGHTLRDTESSRLCIIINATVNLSTGNVLRLNNGELWYHCTAYSCDRAPPGTRTAGPQ